MMDRMRRRLEMLAIFKIASESKIRIGERALFRESQISHTIRRTKTCGDLCDCCGFRGCGQI